jgi:hypothetical protein
MGLRFVCLSLLGEFTRCHIVDHLDVCSHKVVSDFGCYSDELFGSDGIFKFNSRTFKSGTAERILHILVELRIIGKRFKDAKAYGKQAFVKRGKNGKQPRFSGGVDCVLQSVPWSRGVS